MGNIDVVIVPSPDLQVIVQPQTEYIVIEEGQRGADGTSGVIANPVASTALSGDMVVVVFNGEAAYADNQTNYLGQLGLTLGASAQGAQINVCLSGLVTSPGWNFTNGPIWLGTSGGLTQTEPTTGGSVVVGRALSPTSFIFLPETLIERD